MIEMTEEEIDEYLEIICERMFEAYHKLNFILSHDSNIEEAIRYPVSKALQYLLLYKEKRDIARGKRLLTAFDVAMESEFAEAKAAILAISGRLKCEP